MRAQTAERVAGIAATVGLIGLSVFAALSIFDGAPVHWMGIVGASVLVLGGFGAQLYIRMTRLGETHDDPPTIDRGASS